MQEAFRRAALQKPSQAISKEVFGSSDKIRQEKYRHQQEREFKNCQNEFRNLGGEWFLLKGNPVRAGWQHIIEQSIKQRWQRSILKLKHYEPEEQITLLNDFCLGMGLSEERPHPAYYNIIEQLTTIWEKTDKIRKLVGKKESNLSAVSIMFLEVFKDISSYSDEKTVLLDEFIKSKDELQKGKILLPQTLLALTQWLRESSHNS